MKICHITTVHPRYDIRIFWKECISTVNEGNDVTLIVNDNGNDEEIKGVKIITLGNPITSRLSRITSFKTFNRAFKKALLVNADIYHIHDPELLGLGVKLKENGFCVVYDSHEDVPRQILVKGWIPLLLRPIVSYLYELYEDRCAKLFDAIIVPTPHIFDRFKKVNSAVWHVSNFPSLYDIAYTGVNYSNENPACYIGDLTNIRGIRQIAQASHSVGLELILCGKFHSQGLEKYLFDNFDNVSYLGFLDRSSVSDVLKNSSIGFVTLLNTPNDSMSYPIKLFEYMAAGVPVISSDFPIYRDIVEGYNCGICVNPLDIEAISDAIKRIKENKEFAYELHINGRKAIVDKFNWESQINVLMECYSHCMILQ